MDHPQPRLLLRQLLEHLAVLSEEPSLMAITSRLA
jgi:hypothetical protein